MRRRIRRAEQSAWSMVMGGRSRTSYLLVSLYAATPSMSLGGRRAKGFEDAGSMHCDNLSGGIWRIGEG
jgi:hypothetical protein